MKKLSLNKETIANLNSNTMKIINGGADNPKPVTQYQSYCCITMAGNTCDDPIVSCLSAGCIPGELTNCGI